jgi:hypothetical protein
MPQMFIFNANISSSMNLISILTIIVAIPFQLLFHINTIFMSQHLVMNTHKIQCFEVKKKKKKGLGFKIFLCEQGQLDQ